MDGKLVRQSLSYVVSMVARPEVIITVVVATYLFAGSMALLSVISLLLLGSLVVFIHSTFLQAQTQAERTFLLRFAIATHISSLLNPFVLVQSLLISVGQLYSVLKKQTHLPHAEQQLSTLEYRAPFEGEWLVLRGGIEPETSHSWTLLNQRYAYDFTVASHSRELVDREQLALGLYPSYGESILASARGIVVALRDGLKDYPNPGTGWVDLWCRDIRGNHVVIQHTETEFSLAGHLKRGSVCVAVGQEVCEGQKIGECGNSGHSTEPHLHFQVQDRQSFYFCISKSIRWKQMIRNSKLTTPQPVLQTGERIANVS